ncbi:RnfABCDGE type electron transport complex subunit D [Candidatus Woesearchaeota archaeon]|nr:RnfABCDGE type electron transport complex subunit D [Candidatus Woesearchaeota archaeon]
MKGLPEYFKSMYAVTGALLLLLAAVASYNLKVFPTGILIAIAACSLLDVVVKVAFLKKPVTFPSSAVISGTIIGSIAPMNAPAAAILVAAAIAIASKYAIRLKGHHIFNPATLGLLVSLFVFGLGDVWWAAEAGIRISDFFLPLTLFLIIANYTAGKLMAAIPFLLATSALYAITQFVAVPFTASGLLSFFTSMPFYFAFIMLSEPKTSPYPPGQQVVFGIAVAVVYFLLDFSHVRFPFFIALLLGNLAYSVHRNGFFAKNHVNKPA